MVFLWIMMFIGLCLENERDVICPEFGNYASGAKLSSFEIICKHQQTSNMYKRDVLWVLKYLVCMLSICVSVRAYVCVNMHAGKRPDVRFNVIWSVDPVPLFQKASFFFSCQYFY